jgi:GNAT superfamily N-acetyltransferase
MHDGADVSFRACHPGDEPARSLIAAMVDEITAMYGDGPPGVPLRNEELSEPSGTYLVGWCGGEAIAGGGLRTIAPHIGEIKRMYVASAWRGRGVARRLLRALEDAARAAGHEVVRLDTGTRQPDALHLYQSAGYRSIPDYNGNGRAAFWGEKRLV